MQDADFEETKKPFIKSKWLRFFIKSVLFIGSAAVESVSEETEFSKQMKDHCRFRRFNLRQ